MNSRFRWQRWQSPRFMLKTTDFVQYHVLKRYLIIVVNDKLTDCGSLTVLHFIFNVGS